MLWCNLAHKRFAGNLPKNSRKLPGPQQLGRMPKLENGPLQAAPINPGQRTVYRKVPSNCCHLAPLWCNLACKRFGEVSWKLLGSCRAGSPAGRMPKFENGPLRAAPINQGGKSTYRGWPVFVLWGPFAMVAPFLGPWGN